jgi:spore coat protein U-like protein
MNKQILKSTLIAAAGLLFANSAMAAGTDTATFQVTATVADSCLVSATPLAFGAYDPNAATDNEATSTITATCTEGTDYTLALDFGSNGGSATDTTRAMLGGGNYLDYELYSDSSHATDWNATTTVASTAVAGANTHTVYGQILAGRYVPAASYTDTITVTIVY